MQIMNLFSTPIWKVELPLDNDVLIKKIKDFQKNTDSTSKSNIGGYQSNKSFDDKEFNESIINA